MLESMLAIMNGKAQILAFQTIIFLQIMEHSTVQEGAEDKSHICLNDLKVLTAKKTFE